MPIRAIAVAAFLTAFAAVATAPSAEASQPPCVVGDDRGACAVSVETVVCVTYPCDAVTVCVGYGRVCT